MQFSRGKPEAGASLLVALNEKYSEILALNVKETIQRMLKRLCSNALLCSPAFSKNNARL